MIKRRYKKGDGRFIYYYYYVRRGSSARGRSEVKVKDEEGAG